MKKPVEPKVSPENYNVDISNAFNWYHQEKEKKDARQYLKDYISIHFTKNDLRTFNRLPDSKIINTYGWISRMVSNGVLSLSDRDRVKFDAYLQDILDTSDDELEDEVSDDIKIPKPSVRENMEEKVREYLGELEGAVDDFTTVGKELNLYNDLKARSIPHAYCPYIQTWVNRKASEFIFVYESTDSTIKEAYSHFGKRKLTQIIKLFASWNEDLDRYALFKKANRKPRAKKVKPPVQQVAKLKYKKDDLELKLKSVNPAEMVGAQQVWIYNTKYKKLAVYRSDSSDGIQVKGSTLQNYEPENCEQKTIRKPVEALNKVLTAGKIQLRRILADMNTKETPVNGRVNEECIILRVIK